jgi:hypothetical protein
MQCITIYVYSVQNWEKTWWSSFIIVFKSHTHKLYILGHCTNIVYILLHSFEACCYHNRLVEMNMLKQQLKFKDHESDPLCHESNDMINTGTAIFSTNRIKYIKL